MAMNATQLKEWAKEEVRDALLRFFEDQVQSHIHTFDDREALRKQVNRALATVSDKRV